MDSSTIVFGAFLEYHSKLLGRTTSRSLMLTQVIHCDPLVKDTHIVILDAHYTTKETRSALFSKPRSKSPSPEGFDYHFYRDAWDVVGTDIIDVVKDVLQIGNLLEEVNTIIITLISKVKYRKNKCDTI